MKDMWILRCILVHKDIELGELFRADDSRDVLVFHGYAAARHAVLERLEPLDAWTPERLALA